MARYRTLQIEVDAFRWTGGPDQTEDPVWIVEAIREDRVWFERQLRVSMKIVSSSGILTAHLGDWIVRGVKGEIYPVKPDVFAISYEEIT